MNLNGLTNGLTLVTVKNKKMKFPEGKLKSHELNTFLTNSIDAQIRYFIQLLSQYEPVSLFENWKLLIRHIDEFINIPMELKDNKILKDFLQSKIDINNPASFKFSLKVKNDLENYFNKMISERYLKFLLMCSSINTSLKDELYFEKSGSNVNLDNAINIINYFQSRRIYFVTTLFLIPKLAKGNKKIAFMDLLNILLKPVDSTLVNITTSYHKLLINNSIDDYEMIFNSKQQVGIGNFEFGQLEFFYLNPQRLSLLDQLIFRKNEINSIKTIGKSSKKIFSFSEVADTMELLSKAYEKYKIDQSVYFIELNNLFVDISIYLKDDYEITIDEYKFNELQKKYINLKLYEDSSDYFENLNSIAPFQKLNNHYYSTVVLIDRFAYNLIINNLLSLKRFQINSGFVFEDKISKILEKHGFTNTGITRINRKEFDVVTIKGNVIYNFQCKNNFYNIADVSYNYNLVSSLNRRLCKYYEKALEKEEKRENLLKSNLNISKIEHFIISRYPIISRNKRILNFNNLEEWLKNYVT